MYRLLLVIVRTQQSEKHHLQALHMRKESAIDTRLTFKKNLREVSMQAKSIYHCGYVRQRCWSNCAATSTWPIISFLLRVYQNTKPFSLKVRLIEWRSRRHNRDKWRCCCNVGDSTARNSAYYIIHGRSMHAWRMQPRLELGTGVLSGLWGCHTALYFFSQVESHLKALKVFLKFPFSGHGQSTSIFFLLCGQIWQLFEFFWTAPRLKL